MNSKIKFGFLFSAVFVSILAFTFLTCSDFPARAQDTSLVGLWHFDEGSGGTVADSSGKGNNGTINGATWATGQGINGSNALSFNGSNNWIEVPHSSALDPGAGSFSIEFWTKPAADVNGMPLSKYRDSYGPNIGYYINLSASSNYIAIAFSGGDDPDHIFIVNTTSSILFDGNWHHFCTTLDRGDASLNLFIDGKKIQTASASQLGSVDWGGPLYIGRRLYGGSELWFKGQLDELAIYNRALSLDEIKAHYNAGAGPLNTPAGSNVAVPVDGATLTFSQVTEPGNTTITTTTEAPAPVPGTFGLVGTYYDIFSTATYSSPITVSLPYNATGLSTEQQQILKLQQYDNGNWVDITISVDTVNHIITGSAPHLSYFAVTLPDIISPAVSSTNPANNAADVQVYRTINISFSEAMNKNSAQTAFSINPSVSGAFSWDGNTMTFTPSSLLALSTAYTVTIGTGAKDLAGNSLASPYSFSFTTSATDPSLVGLWHFDKVSENKVIDSSAYGNDGTIYGATLVDSKPGLGKALDFNGVDNYVNVADSPSLQLPNALTVMAWTYPRASSVYGPISVYGQIVVKGTAGSGPNYNYRIAETGSDYCYFGPGVTQTRPREYALNISDAAYKVPLGSWYHIAFTADGSTLKEYLNGAFRRSVYAPGPYKVCAGSPVRFGYLYGINPNPPNYAYKFNGIIDEVRIYNRALSDTEIQAIYEEISEPADTTPPTVTITSPSEGLLTKDDVTLSYTVTDDVSSPNKITVSPASGTVYSTEGTQTITVIATDEAGNTSSKSVSFTIDKTAPAVTIDSPSEGLVTKDNVTLSYTVADDVSSPDKITISPASGTVYSTEGTQIITVIATDEAGNTSSKSVSFTIDKTAPAITITSPQAQIYLNNQHDLKVAYTVNDSNLDKDSVKVTLDGAPLNTDTLDLTQMDLGKHQLKMEAKDLAGNTNLASVIFEVQMKPLSSFMIKNLEISWKPETRQHKVRSDRITISGKLDLPSPYTKADIISDVTVMLEVGSSSGTDTVLANTHKLRWHYKHKKFEVPPDTNLDIKRLNIKWAGREGKMDTFNIEGYMDAENDNSGKVTLTLILPLKAGGDMSGTQTVTCKTSKRSWEYKAK